MRCYALELIIACGIFNENENHSNDIVSRYLNDAVVISSNRTTNSQWRHTPCAYTVRTCSKLPTSMYLKVFLRAPFLVPSTAPWPSSHASKYALMRAMKLPSFLVTENSPFAAMFTVKTRYSSIDSPARRFFVLKTRSASHVVPWPTFQALKYALLRGWNYCTIFVTANSQCAALITVKPRTPLYRYPSAPPLSTEKLYIAPTKPIMTV